MKFATPFVFHHPQMRHTDDVSLTIKQFRRFGAPILRPKTGRPKGEKFRGSRQSRGYDADWTRLRNEYAASVLGLCEECERRGYVTPLTDIDHMVPIADHPEGRLDWDNLDGLCRDHHKGFKARLEAYARKTMQIQMLPTWVKRPETRPIQFQIHKFGPMKGDIDGDGS